MANDTTKHPDAERIRAHIVDRAAACSESCNSHHINHVQGVMRGLLIALTGEDHGPPKDLAKTLVLAGIPHTVTGSGLEALAEIPDEWLASHGLGKNWKLQVQR